MADVLPFERSRHRAFRDIARAIGSCDSSGEDSSDDCVDTSPFAAQTVEHPEVSDEVHSLRKEICRIRKEIRSMRRKRDKDASRTAAGRRTSHHHAEPRPQRKLFSAGKDERGFRPIRNREAKGVILRRAPEPTTRGMAIMLARHLEVVLPEGNIEKKFHRLSRNGGLGAENGALVPSGIHRQLDAFGDDFTIIDATLREGARQVRAECKDRGDLLDAIRERYGELFSTMHDVCDRWQRRNESLAIELDEVHNALESKEVERIALTEHATKCEREVDSARRRHQADCERATSITQRSRQREKELMTMQTIDRAEIRRLHERIKLTEAQSRHEIESAVASMEDSLHNAFNERDTLSRRVEFLDNQLLTTRMLVYDKSQYATTQTQTIEDSIAVEELSEPVSASIATQTDVVIFAKRRRKTERMGKRNGTLVHHATLAINDGVDGWARESLGDFSCLISSQKTGRRKPRAWVLKCIAHIYADRLTLDTSGFEHNDDSARDASTHSLATFVYDWHLHKFGLKQLAEANLLDLIASTVHHADDCDIIHQFGLFCHCITSTSSRDSPLLDAPTLAFYLRLLEALAGDSHFTQLLVELGMVKESKSTNASLSAGVLAFSRASEALKLVFVDYKDEPSTLKEFVAKQFGLKHVASSSTVKFSTFVRAVMVEYKRRRAINVESLKALFRAADCDADGFLIHDEFAAALRVADKRITETTIDAVFKSCSSRTVISDTKTKAVRLDDFVKSCIANGLEQFSPLFEPGLDAAAQRKKYASNADGSMSTWTMSPEKWFTRVDELMTSTDAPYAKYRALSADAALRLERCRRQLHRLQTLLIDRLDGEAAYLAHKLFAADVRQACVRAKGGFKRFGAAVLHQVSFSMRAYADAADAAGDADTDVSRDDHDAIA